MEFSAALARLEGSDEYAKFCKQHTKAFLAHAFFSGNQWQLGYFDGTKMTTFVMDKSITQTQTTEILRTEHDIMPLETRDIVIPVAKALENAETERKKNYPAELPIQTFFIIQTLDIGTVYNITFFTKSFKTVNVKLSAKDGTVIRHTCSALFDMDAMRDKIAAKK